MFDAAAYAELDPTISLVPTRHECVGCGHKWLRKRSFDPCPKCLLTPKQAEVNYLLGGHQRHTLVYGGARSGKTVLFVRAILHRAIKAEGSRHAMLRLHGNAARASLWLDTLPTVHQTWFPKFHLIDHRQDGYVEIEETGSEIWITGTDEPHRVEKILGMEFITLYFNECSQYPYSTVLLFLTRLAQTHPKIMQRAYYDLNPVGSKHFTAQLFLRGLDPQSGQPARDMRERAHAWMNPKDNLANLSLAYLQSLMVLPERQRKRFWEGIFQADIDGALWTFESIDACRIEPDQKPETMQRVVVAIDPSGAKNKEDKRSDEIGIIVAGKGADGFAYVLADRTCIAGPEGWARVAIKAYQDFSADRIVAEANFGGEMVRSTIHAQDRNVPVHLVHASRGKAQRAEPVSALYGSEVEGVGWKPGLVRHVGPFPQLEDQLLNFSSAGYLGEKSPDRADALIWAITDLELAQMKDYGIYELYRQRSEALDQVKAQRPVVPTGNAPRLDPRNFRR